PLGWPCWGLWWMSSGIRSFLTENLQPTSLPTARNDRCKKSAPVRERLAVAAFRVEDKFLQSFYAPEKLLKQARQRVVVVEIPFGRDFLREILEHTVGKI